MRQEAHLGYSVLRIIDVGELIKNDQIASHK
jgi:hypothetical protein